MDSGNPLRLEPLGQSGAAAIVVSALYFIGVLATIANWVVTKFTFYDVVLIACLRAFPCHYPLSMAHLHEHVRRTAVADCTDSLLRTLQRLPADAAVSCLHTSLQCVYNLQAPSAASKFVARHHALAIEPSRWIDYQCKGLAFRSLTVWEVC